MVPILRSLIYWFDALLVLGADPTEARYFKLSRYFSVKTEPQFLDGQLTAPGNHALHPAWNMDADSDLERSIAFSKMRRSNFVKYLSQDPSTNNDTNRFLG